jgi:hypothetical protein
VQMKKCEWEVQMGSANEKVRTGSANGKCKWEVQMRKCGVRSLFA